jgi:hypothetical protein
LCNESSEEDIVQPINMQEIAMTDSPPDRKKLVVFGLCVAGLSLFMYVSFIAKVAFDGP